MEQIEYKKLSISELEEIVKQCEEYHTHGCAGISCDECVSTSTHYKDIARMPCRDAWGILKKRLEELKGGSGDIYKDTLETIVITPETTSIKYLVETGYVHALAEVFSDNDKILGHCSGRDCSSCKLNQSNYSDDIPKSNCGEARNYITIASDILKKMGNSTEKKVCDTCNNCTYLQRQTDFLFCKAWNNFTTEDMYCGYHNRLDK